MCVFASVTDASSDEIILVEKGFVPDVTGISLSEAQSALDAAGLTVGEIIYFYNDHYPLDQVFDQNPYPGQQVEDGTPVDLWVSAGLNPCPEFFDEWGVLLPQLQAGERLLTPLSNWAGGDDLAEFYDYDAWDINEDGVPERLALELVAHIMCLPDTYVHPILGPVKPMQDAFYGTHTYVNTFLKKLYGIKKTPLLH